MTDLEIAQFLASQLGAAASLDAVARLFVHLMERGLLQQRDAVRWVLVYLADRDWLEEVAAAGVPGPCCAFVKGLD